MHDIVEWLGQGTPGLDEAVLVRPIDYGGIGTRSSTDVIVVTADSRLHGALLWGACDERIPTLLAELDGSPAVLSQVEITDAAAQAAGLVCGGRVSLLVQRAVELPAEFVEALRAGERAILLTDLGRGRCDYVPAPRRGDLEGSWGTTIDEHVARLLGAGTTAAHRVTAAEQDLLLEVFVPVTRLLLVGTALMPAAVAELAVALGWEPVTVNSIEAVLAQLPGLGPVGGVVVFSHDPELGPAALAAALRCGVRYVGAMGSRRTQAARAHTLSELGVPAADVDRIHGPVGLNLGARNPRETALVICAEFLGVVTGRI